jgi:hypothetical protein
MRRPPVYDRPPDYPPEAPLRLPKLGAVLRLGDGEWRYRSGRPAELVIEVTVVREEISWWYGGQWVWVYGWRLDEHGGRVGDQPVPVLVRIDAIPATCAANGYPGQG